MALQTVAGPNGAILAVVPEDTKVDIRRFTGYPAYGYGVTGFYEMGLFLAAYQTLELRMNSLTVSEYTRLTSLFLPNLYALEQDLFDIRDNLDMESAAVYKRNANELAERRALFSEWQKRLCDFLGVPNGPNNTSTNSVPLFY